MSLFCFAVLCVLSSFAIISLGKKRAGCFSLLCSECHLAVIILRLFNTVPWVGLLYVIVAFPGHTHVLSLKKLVEILTRDQLMKIF